MRNAVISRNTGETQIRLELGLDGKGTADLCGGTGIGFFDHMLNAFARHGFFDLKIEEKGDLEVDGHHLVEDTGIVLGNAIRDAAGDKAGIRRYGYFILPMDEALVLCAVDLCGRPYFAMDFENGRDGFSTPMVGEFDTQLVKEFFYSVSYGAMMNLHFKILSGENDHHIIEAMFKAFANALKIAATVGRDASEVLSTKGSL